MEPDKFDYKIKEKMEGRSIVPSADAWAKLEVMLDNAELPQNKPSSRSWIYIAASVVSFLVVGTVFFTTFESNGIQKSSPVVLDPSEHIIPHTEVESLQEAIVSTQNGSSNRLTNQGVASKESVKKASRENNQSAQLVITNHSKEPSVTTSAVDNKIVAPTAGNKYISGEELLAEVTNVQGVSNVVSKVNHPAQGFKVNPNSLLSNAETELNQTFRESTLNKLSKNFNSIKTAVVNRNYEE